MSESGKQSWVMRGLSRLRLPFFWGMVALASLYMAQQCLYILEAVEFEWLRPFMFVLFVSCFTWISVPFFIALAGLVLIVFRIDPLCLERREPLAPPVKQLTKRTAIVMPIYNESPVGVFGAVAAMYDALQGLPNAGLFEFFLLSDTRDAQVAADELRFHAQMRREGRERIFYRRREQNIGRKSGNIEDFITRWGSRYEYMIVLDADSIMDATALRSLACYMEANPLAGIIQTSPSVIFAETLFARLIQFSARLYGRLFSYGAAFWYGATSNYWGHNAIIRVESFRAHCGLAELPGPPPLGGQILSHDFVEAALLRAAGLGVYLLPHLEGSYEQIPPNPLEFLQRDKRWSQGNLQHLKLLFRPRLTISSRAFFVMGALAYISSPLWLALLILSTVDCVLEAITPHQYYTQQHQLFPDWPISRADEALQLFGITSLVLFAPKFGALFLALREKGMRNAFGGTIRIVSSVLFEVVFFMLFAPMMMMFHSRFVAITLVGKIVPWNPQNRTKGDISFWDALRATWSTSLIAFVWSALLFFLSRDHLLWMAPVLLGLLLSPVLVWFSSSWNLGQFAKRLGLFMSPEETMPPEILTSVLTYQQRLESLPGGIVEPVQEPATPPESPSVMQQSDIFAKIKRPDAALLH
jgi:membrane glycosyltransferase